MAIQLNTVSISFKQADDEFEEVYFQASNEASSNLASQTAATVNSATAITQAILSPSLPLDLEEAGPSQPADLQETLASSTQPRLTTTSHLVPSSQTPPLSPRQPTDLQETIAAHQSIAHATQQSAYITPPYSATTTDLSSAATAEKEVLTASLELGQSSDAPPAEQNKSFSFKNWFLQMICCQCCNCCVTKTKET